MIQSADPTIAGAGPDPRIALASHDARMSDGAVIRLRRHGNPDGPRVVLSHGNGLAIDGYAAWWSLLAPDHDLVLFDLRNHGANPLHEPHAYTWQRLTDDVGEIRSAIDQAFGDKPAVGAFHSLSAICSVAHLVEHGPVYQGLLLFDPPVYPPHGHALESIELADMHKLAAGARRRTERYDSPLELAAQFARRKAFERWVPGAARDMAAATLRADPVAGGYTLCCPRELEALMYERNDDQRIWAALTRPQAIPIRILGGDPFLDGQAPPPVLCHAMSKVLPGLSYDWLPGTTHFLQIEEPERCRDETAVFVGSALRTPDARAG